MHGTTIKIEVKQLHVLYMHINQKKHSAKLYPCLTSDTMKQDMTFHVHKA